jgi:hypothetical protein
MSIIKNEATQRVIKIVIFALLIVGIVAGGFFGGFYTKAEMVKREFSSYSIKATVTEVIEEKNEVYFETSSGHIFYITTDEIFSPFEVYTIVFDTMGTPTVDDDEISTIYREINIK